jgi:hypothetical protein
MGFEKSFDFVGIPVGVVQPFEHCELLLRDKSFHTFSALHLFSCFLPFPSSDLP